MNVVIIYVGDAKERYLNEAANEYIKRISAFANVTEHELKEHKLPQSPSVKQIEQALRAESVAIRAAIPKRAVRCAMCIEGTQRSSEEFATLVDNIKATSDTVAFIIGSSYGLDPTLKSECEYRLSMSKMTFPHRLARVLLLEQLYRAFMINTNRQYHK